jgi:hypothetical protein
MMSLVWELELPDSEKLVLLALADCANDEGRCWPGMAALVRKCSKSDRTVQGSIIALCSKGHLTRIEVPGRGCNYIVHPIVRFADPRSGFTPEVASPPKRTTQTPEVASGKPSGTVIVKDSEERERAILKSPQWRAFKAMRRDIKKPVNPTSEKRLLAKLLSLDDDGYPPGDVLDQSTENCWRGVFKIQEQEDGRNQNRGDHGRMGGPRPDPTLALVRAATAAQREDGGDYGEARPALPTRKFG